MTAATVWARSTSDLAAPDADHLARLQRRRESALVTVTLATAAGRSLDRAGWSRLERLLADASRRLAVEPGDGVAAPAVWLEQFERLRDRLRSARVGAGFVAFLSPSDVEVVALPTPPVDRVVVDPTFATRDLAEALWASPDILLLVMSASEARLFEASGDVVRVVEDGPFPLHASRPRSTIGSGRPRASRPPSERAGGSAVNTFLRLVGDEVALIRRGRPVVLFAAEPVASRFRSKARVPLLGVIHGNRISARPADLWMLTEPLRREHLEEIRRTHLGRLDAATSAWRGAVGLDEVWSAAEAGRVDTLLVDPLFRCAGTASDGIVDRVRDPATPGVVDDLVDDLIEEVSKRGGTVCFLGEGELEGDGVVAVLRHAS